MITFHDLYQKHARDVYRFAYYLSGSAAEADDITSETFVRVWTAGNELRIQTVKAYLLTIARNLYLEGIRKSKHRVELDPEMPDTAGDPQEIAESRTELEAVMKFLQTIPADDRAVFLMRVQDQLSYEEIARIHRISVTAAKVKVHRVRLKLIKQKDQI